MRTYFGAKTSYIIIVSQKYKYHYLSSLLGYQEISVKGIKVMHVESRASNKCNANRFSYTTGSCSYILTANNSCRKQTELAFRNFRSSWLVQTLTLVCTKLNFSISINSKLHSPTTSAITKWPNGCKVNWNNLISLQFLHCLCSLFCRQESWPN